VAHVTEAHLDFAMPAARLTRTERFANSLELDINSDAENSTAFDIGFQHQLVDELVGLGLEITEKGDVK
jgi:hypothetical protein